MTKRILESFSTFIDESAQIKKQLLQHGWRLKGHAGELGAVYQHDRFGSIAVQKKRSVVTS